MSCPAEQDLLQLGRTSLWTSSDRLQGNGFQRRVLRALVTPLVTEFDHDSQPIKLRATTTKQEFLAASVSRAAVTLNVLPGLGSEGELVTLTTHQRADQSLEEGGGMGQLGPCPHVDGPQKFLLVF